MSYHHMGRRSRIMMDWDEGRQQTGYYKKQLFVSKQFKFDIYLLKYPVDSYIPSHIDSAIISFHEHHRLNIVLKHAKYGGQFYINKIIQKGRFHYFRPDLVKHKVTKIKKGVRYVLSIGWNKEKKQKPIEWCKCNGCYEIPPDWICPKCDKPIP